MKNSQDKKISSYHNLFTESKQYIGSLNFQKKIITWKKEKIPWKEIQYTEEEKIKFNEKNIKYKEKRTNAMKISNTKKKEQMQWKYQIQWKKNKCNENIKFNEKR